MIDKDNEQKMGRSSPESGGLAEDETVVAVQEGGVINASGYKDQLKRQYGLVGLAGIALTVDNAWVALGSSISVSIGMCYHKQPTVAARASSRSCPEKTYLPTTRADDGPQTQRTAGPLALSSA